MFSLSVNDNVPLSVVTDISNILKIDSSGSTIGGEESGATSGEHGYRFTRDRLISDPLASETALTLTGSSKTALIGGVLTKNVTGNSWNAAVYSTEVFDCNEVFAITWEVYESASWVRQMGGLAMNNTGLSYRDLTHSLYQVNSYAYHYNYESGSAKVNPLVTTAIKYVVPGDRMGIRVSSGLIEYILIKGSVIYSLGYSEKSASGICNFMCAFNRGKTSTSTSKLEKAWLHTGTTLTNETINIRGDSDELVSQEHKDQLKTIGLDVLSGATYGILTMSRQDVPAFNAGGVPTEITMVHEYFGTTLQDVKSI